MTIETARKCCRRAEDTSNVDTDDEPARYRRAPLRFSMESSEDSNSDEEGTISVFVYQFLKILFSVLCHTTELFKTLTIYINAVFVYERK